MPELKNTFTGGKMEKDLDERLIPSGQYRDAWNIQVATSEESDLGSIQNILGNKKINNNLISSNHICVGSIADDKNNKLYLLLAGKTSNVQSKIIEWDPIAETLVPVLVDHTICGSSFPCALNFDPTKIITGINIVDDMLFWTDNHGEPKRINIPRSKEGTEGTGTFVSRLINPAQNIDFNSGIIMREEYVTVIKKAPKVAPVLRLESKGSTSIRLYCSKPVEDHFSSSNIGIGGEVTIDVRDLIPGYYGNAVADYYKPGDFLYLKAVEKTPNVFDPDFDDLWSNGSDGDYDVKLQINAPFGVGPTIGNEFAMGGLANQTEMFGSTPITCTLVGPSSGGVFNGKLADIYTVTNLSDPPIIFEKKFPRFATRWKYLDGETSAISPFSQIAFSPGIFSYHPKKGHNLGMVNTLYAVHVEQFIPINIPKDVIAVDILYREAGSSNIYIVDTISKNDPNIIGKSFNYWDSYYEDSMLSPSYSGCNNSGQCFDPNNANEPSETVRMKGTYKITSDNISKAIPENQTLRHWDNVPRVAKAQEVIGNRLVYGNYLQNYDLYEGISATRSDNPYKPRFEIGVEKYNIVDTQEARGNYIQSKPSIKSLRTYQVGIVYEDKYGRKTPVLTSSSGVLNTDKSIASSQHRLTIKPLTNPPDWATDYRYFIKETSSEYYNLAMDRVYDAEDGNIWLAFPSSDRAKIDEEDYLILKKDANGTFVEQDARYKILAITNEVPEFVKTIQRQLFPNIGYTGNSGNVWNTGTFPTAEDVPVEGLTFFTVQTAPADIINIAREYQDSISQPSGAITLTRDIAKFSMRVVDDGTSGQFTGVSDWFDIKKIETNTSAQIPTMDVTLESPLNESVRFSYSMASGSVVRTQSTTRIEIRVGKEEYKSWFDGRFFVKIERDSTIDSRVITASETNLVPTSRKQLYYIHSGEGSGIIKDTDSFNSVGSTFVTHKMPNVSDNTIYSASTLATGGDPVLDAYAKRFKGGYAAYGDTPYSRIKNPIGCHLHAPHCDGSTSPSSTTTCADKTCLEGHIPPGGLTVASPGSNGYYFQNGLAHNYEGNAFNRATWLHYTGVYDYRGTTLTTTPTAYQTYVNENDPGFWFIDRTYRHVNLSTNHNGNNISLGANMKFSNGTCPIGNGHRFGGIDCNKQTTPFTMDLSFTGVLDSSSQGYLNNLPVSPNGGFDGSLPQPYEFSFLNNSLHAKEHDFAKKLRIGTKVRFTDDKTGPNETPIIRTIVAVEGPWSSVANGETTGQPQSGANSKPEEHYNFRMTWRISFDTPFGNPVIGARGYNPLYTFKDVVYYDDDGTTEIQCPRDECTGGAIYPWAPAKSQATMYSNLNDHVNDGSSGFIPTQMEIMEDHTSVGDDQKVVSKNPVIWETEPKRDSDLDIYYEASGSYNINILGTTDNPTLRIGSYVRISKSNPSYHTNPVVNGKTWHQRNNLDGHTIAANSGDDSLPGSNSPVIINISNGIYLTLGDTADVNGDLSIEDGTILDVIFKGTRIEVVVSGALQGSNGDNSFSDGGKQITINNNFHGNKVSLDWYNCYVFGDDIGVESNRIRDDFNGVRIDNGPKASTTVVEGSYKQERIKSGLIYSGLYNSIAGLNNLNQFIVGEKITKNLNPTYGSIQKLHARNTDLVTLCENKVLKILANKDALFNASGDPQLISNENVLGQAIPFVGEYGISKNPESFASEAYRSYFTDIRRGVVLRLSKDGLTAISEHGMRNWFNDYFVTNEKDLGSEYVIGSYDRRKQNYNVTFKNKTVSFNEGAKGWVSFQSMSPDLIDFDGTSLQIGNSDNDFHGVSLNNKYYTFRRGGLWEQHDPSADYNNLYNYDVSSSVTTILNEAPEIVKSFNTLNYEGSQSKIDQITTQTIGLTTYSDNQYYNLNNVAGWYANSIITDKGKSTEQEGTVNEFIEKEGKWFNYIKGTSTPNIVSELDPSEFSLQGIGFAANSVINQDVYGCTDNGQYDQAWWDTNYAVSTGIAVYPGGQAYNYDAGATIDDGTCSYCLLSGCMDPAADNFNNLADCDDGSCIYIGCMITGAFNFNTSANTACNSGSANDCCIDYIYGCRDLAASNYNSGANTWCNNSSSFNSSNSWTVTAMDDGALAGSASSNCCEYPVTGCIDELACDYDPAATVSAACDYTCIGCSDPTACNFDNAATSCLVAAGSTVTTTISAKFRIRTFEKEDVTNNAGGPYCVNPAAFNVQGYCNNKEHMREIYFSRSLNNNYPSTLFYPGQHVGVYQYNPAISPPHCAPTVTSGWNSDPNENLSGDIIQFIGGNSNTGNSYGSANSTLGTPPTDMTTNWTSGVIIKAIKNQNGDNILTGGITPTILVADSKQLDPSYSCNTPVPGSTDRRNYYYFTIDVPPNNIDYTKLSVNAMTGANNTPTWDQYSQYAAYNSINYYPSQTYAYNPFDIEIEVDTTVAASYLDPGGTSCCDYCTYGCTNSSASNYSNWTNVNVTQPCDGSALSNSQSGWVQGTYVDNSCINGQTGANCCCDLNYTPVYGCTDPTAANYNGSATDDDGTCCYGGCSTGSTTGTQPDINGYCNNMGCTGAPNYTNCDYVGICDPASGVYTGCDGCRVASGSTYLDSGYHNINYDRDLCYDCGEANNNTDCYDCVDALNGSDTTCCIPTVYGCMDAIATNYNSLASADDGSCTYNNTSGCWTHGACNYCSPGGVISPGNPTGNPNICLTENSYSCEYATCQGCIRSDLGYFAGQKIDGTYVCRGSSNIVGNLTTHLWQDTSGGSHDGTWFCSDSGDLSGSKEGWMAKNYCPDCDMLWWTGINTQNPNNTMGGAGYNSCTYEGAGCTDDGNYSQYTAPGVNYVNQAAVSTGLGIHQPASNQPAPYQYGSITPGQPAKNWNPLASTDDGSCYPVIYGCLDQAASNYGHKAASGNFGWGGSGNTLSLGVFEKVNTHASGACAYLTAGCTDDSANQFVHDGSDFTDTDGGMRYAAQHNVWPFGVYKSMFWNFTGMTSGSGGIGAGAFNYRQAAGSLQPGTWEADVPIDSGYDGSNTGTVQNIYSNVSSGCESDPASCDGNGNESACCYMAGCIHPLAVNYDYNGYGGSARNKVRATNPNGSITFPNVDTAVGGLAQSGGGQFHRTCADCAGTKATSYFVHPTTGAQLALSDPNTFPPGAYLSYNLVDQYADVSCCCFPRSAGYALANGGCTDPTACNYAGDSLNLAQFFVANLSCDTGTCEYSSCADCNGTPNGSAYVDQCSNCVGGTTGQSPCSINNGGISN